MLATAGRRALRLASPGRSLSTLHDFSAKTLAGVDTSLSAFKGKPALVVNVASL